MWKWMLCIAALATAMACALMWLKSHRSPQLFGSCIHRVATSEKVVALTYDDGPSPYTEELLEVLRKHGVHATFFLLGKHLEEYPELARRLHLEGHELGNHSYSHQQLIFRRPSFIREEIEKTDRLIRQIGYEGIIHFRAPYGRKLILLPWILLRSGRPHILFDVIPDDWAQPGAETIADRIMAQVRPGSIILCHDGDGEGARGDRSQTVQATDFAIERLKEAGYRLVTVSELMQLMSINI